MDAQKVLILEFDRDFGYAQALSGILESAKGLLLISTVVREFSPLAAAPSQDRFDATVIATPRLTDDVHLSLKSDLSGRNGPVIVVAGEVSHTEIIDLLRSGVSEVLPGTPTAATVVPCLWRLLHWCGGLGQKLKQEVGLSRMVGTSPRFVAEVNKIRLAASVLS